MDKKSLTLEAKGQQISIIASENHNDYISLTDIAKYKNSDRTDIVVLNWLRNRNTIEFLGVWEQMYNINFNPIEFDWIKSQAGLNSFVLTPKQWIEGTSAIGIISKAGRYGGTYAHNSVKEVLEPLFGSKTSFTTPTLTNRVITPTQ
ncbi:KilA-N domain-containing protein [Tissierella sp.]|uniref:KilA-N domain-containing protein n=1 Tax=Tissierella sp. TaxID=41274 RepID=UPI002862F962|nr:KilA-N domain-containing protein [Tissierella sp.]MDR7856816.1 KilA-N domain-containing protein [Tissierella sp.]